MTSQSPVFLLNSRHPLVCATPSRLPEARSCLSRSYACKLPSSFSIVLSSALVYSTSPPVSVSGTVSRGGYFLEPLHSKDQSNKASLFTRSVTTRWPRNIHLVPIDYAFRPRLRGRLTLRRLALRRNPWTFGGSVSHTPVVTHVCIRTSDTSRTPHGYPFTGLRNAPLPHFRARNFGA